VNCPREHQVSRELWEKEGEKGKNKGLVKRKAGNERWRKPLGRPWTRGLLSAFL
jgi:hypothetical protein